MRYEVHYTQCCLSLTHKLSHTCLQIMESKAPKREECWSFISMIWQVIDMVVAVHGVVTVCPLCINYLYFRHCCHVFHLSSSLFFRYLYPVCLRPDHLLISSPDLSHGSLPPPPLFLPPTIFPSLSFFFQKSTFPHEKLPALSNWIDKAVILNERKWCQGHVSIFAAKVKNSNKNLIMQILEQH